MTNTRRETLTLLDERRTLWVRRRYEYHLDKLVLLALWVPLIVLGQTDWTMNTTSGRPMREVVRELRERFGWVISYEEGVYDPSHVQRDGPSSFALASARMSFSLPESRLANARSLSASDRVAVLRDLAAQHARQSDMAFRVTADGAHVIPTIRATARAALPEGDAYQSPLETPVTLQPAEAYPNLAAAIQDVVAQVGSARGIPISVGMMPFNVVLNKRMLFDVPQGSNAREALFSLLHEVNADPSAFYAPVDQLTWELAYDPNSRGFFFNVVIVPNSAPKVQITTDPPVPPAGSGVGTRVGRP